ncbi:MAG: hypothetical protein GY696_18810 [Gammaproteobacteria bacterium]|nr:hypothetical protein [Gammaproteobacteria bacterium]
MYVIVYNLNILVSALYPRQSGVLPRGVSYHPYNHAHVEKFSVHGTTPSRQTVPGYPTLEAKKPDSSLKIITRPGYQPPDDAKMPSTGPGYLQPDIKMPSTGPSYQQPDAKIPNIGPGYQQSEEKMPSLVPGYQQSEAKMSNIGSGYQKPQAKMPSIEPGYQQPDTKMSLGTKFPLNTMKCAQSPHNSSGNFILHPPVLAYECCCCIVCSVLSCIGMIYKYRM